MEYKKKTAVYTVHPPTFCLNIDIVTGLWKIHIGWSALKRYWDEHNISLCKQMSKQQTLRILIAQLFYLTIFTILQAACT